MTAAQEILCQGEALTHVHGFVDDELGTIFKYGALFRRILTEHQLVCKDCTPSDILWIASQKLHKDIQSK